MTSIVEVIQHYQRSIDSSQDNEARLLHCINKLYKLPIKVEHLQETGVGKTVNSLRKFNGEIGMAAKTLVTKWKAMVAAEEEPMDTSSQNNENETPKNDDIDDAGSTPRNDEDDENLNRNNTSQQPEKDKHRNGDKKDKNKDRHKERSSSSSGGGGGGGHKDSKSSSSTSHHHHGSEKSSKHSSDKHKTTTTSSSTSLKDKETHHKSSSDHNSSSNNKNKERETEKTDHKSRKENHIDKDDKHDKHDKDKKREDKSKKDKEHKTDSTHHKSKTHSTSSSSSKSKHDDSHNHSVSKEKERSEKHKSSSKDKERTKEEKCSSSKDNPEHKSSTHSSTSKSTTKDSESSERKRRHNSDDDSTDFKSPQPKVAKIQKPTKLESSPAQEEEEADDCFDSSMGANFDDVLGMLNMPKKKSKKSLKSPTTPSNSSSSSSKKESSTPLKTPTNVNSSGGSEGSKLNGSSRPTIPSSLYSTPSTSKASTMKPDLLAPTAKLEPLDPSIVLELPTISTNYKPMPLNQTVMDCVFNNSTNSKAPPVRTLTDAEAMSHGISSKTIRTKIYSGVRTGQTYQVPTLFDMCIRILQKNIDALEYTGGVPFEVLKPVLERATPQQLYVFEEYNPYLMEDSDVLWQQHVSRNFRTKKRLENESWREMFIRCQEEEERRLSVLKDSIKASQKIAAAPVRKTQLAFVDSMVKPPRNVLKKQEQYGTKSKLVATPAARVASLSSVTPNAAKTGDQRLRVAATVRDHAQVSSSAIRTKKAPLMQKTLQFIRGRHKR